MNATSTDQLQIQAIDAITAMLPVIPFDEGEATFMLQVTRGWREKDRRGAFLWNSAWEAAKPLEACTAAERLQMLNGAMGGGWIPLWLVDQASEFLIFKVSKGRGLFGDKTSYHLYMVGDGGQPVFNSEYKSLMGLVSKVGTLYH